MQPVVRAASFAAHTHRDPRRKDRQRSPCINHPRALTQVLLTEGRISDPVTLAVAPLHDLIEDTHASHDELRGQFGTRARSRGAALGSTRPTAGGRSALGCRQPGVQEAVPP